MPRGRLLLFALAAALVLAALLPAPADAARRCRALDGDTVRCGRERIRLREVHAAERGMPGAEAERRALQRRLDSGEVKVRRHGKDSYGRTLGDVYVNGRKVTQSDIGPRGGRGADYRKSPRSHIAHVDKHAPSRTHTSQRKPRASRTGASTGSQRR